jgi:hypothetical protein
MANVTANPSRDKFQADKFLDRIDQTDVLLPDRFNILVEHWKSGRNPISSVKAMSQHPAYQEIISMGSRVVPLIIQELEKNPDLWFVALHAITGVNPVPEKSRGKLMEMAQAWIDWWRKESAA